jgi:hypothetical protein
MADCNGTRLLYRIMLAFFDGHRDLEDLLLERALRAI